ncbi:MAG: ATP-binding protein [Woeseiaceae bacterium]|nr:ATP-binding protein [Woeseiaceae bacterium]
MNLRFSLAGRIAFLTSALLVVVTAAGAFLTRVLEPWWLAWVIALLISLPLLWIGIHRMLKPSVRLMRALTDGTESLKDHDFSISIADKASDELGDLVAAHNELGSALRDERQSLYQRELLLDTVIQSTDIALLLANANDHVVYSNAAARQLFNGGKPINGFPLEALLDNVPAAFGDAVASERNGLFTLEGEDPRTYHLSQEAFTLNAQPHQLFLFKHLTQELSRQEVATWKKVIRVISHELNNSLAPISSLAHSGSVLVDKSDADDRLQTIFSTIEDRSSHLKNFIGSYAEFARLPAPRVEALNWPQFLEGLRNTVSFRLAEPLPEIDSRVDPVQFEQVLINLLKNAHESGSPPEDIVVAVERQPDATVFTVTDSGGGISDEVMQSALLPFYSTKKSGTGLGLPLCREIVEAHGGRLSLVNIPDTGLQVRISVPD